MFEMPRIAPERLQLLAALCKLIVDNYASDGLPYGFSSGAHFSRQGMLEPPEGFTGLTCASFVLAIFESEALEIIDHSAWLADPSDEEWERHIIQILECCLGIEHEHVQALQKTVPSARYSPQHVTAAAVSFPPSQTRAGVDSKAVEIHAELGRLAAS